MNLVARLVAILRSAPWHELQLRSAALAWASLWAIAPAALLFLAALGWLLPDSGPLAESVASLVARAFPGRNVEPVLRDLIRAADLEGSVRALRDARAGVAIMGLLGWFASGTSFVSAAGEQLDALLRLPHPRGWIRRRGMAIGALLIVLALETAACALALAPPALLRSGRPAILRWVAESSVPVLAWALYAVFLRVLPSGRNRWPVAMRTGFLMALVWWLLRSVATWFLAMPGFRHPVAGLAGTVLVALAWLQASIWLLLFGAWWIGRADTPESTDPEGGPRYNGPAP